MKDSGRKPGRKDSEKPGKAGKDDRSKRDRKLRDSLGNPFLWLVPFLLVVILGWAVFSSMFGYRTIDTSDGLTLLRDKPDTIKSITVVDGNQRVELDLSSTYVQPKKKGIESRPVGKKVEFSYTDAQAEQVDRLVQAAAPKEGFNSVVPTTSWWSSLIQLLVPALLLGGIMWWLISRMGGGRGGAMGFGRSKAKVGSKEMPDVTFDDVAGEDEAVEELEEIREFLSEPEKFRAVGAKIPKGVLLYGPPGTGKTLLAKAVAGEAGVPFFSMAASEFVEMFVGVGASRVRDLFRQAKEKAPCIVFIDEIDAVGRARGKNVNMTSNDERESTLNQLLTEMDGFGSNSGVIILAATNRADVLDKALLRAGRFDRQIHVELPDLNERKEIFNVHLRPIKIDSSVDTDFLARQTPGFSGADIANVCNEAALIAARGGKRFVQKDDFMNAVDRIIGGLEKRTRITTAQERRSIAYHEAGHASISWLLEYANPLVKVTIVPRGKALGAAWYLPEERQITTREQLLDEMCATLGGRAAEEIFLGAISTGASNDLERVTKQAYAMVTYFGMSDQLPNLNYYDSTGQEWGFTKPYSEETARLIDKEVQKIINEQYDRARTILRDNAAKHNQLAEKLLECEVIYSEDLEKIFGKRPWASRSEEIMEQQAADASTTAPHV